MIDIPPLRDPCWLLEEWRTDQLKKIIAEKALTYADITRITGAKFNTVVMWRSGKHRPIPVTTLRLVMFECNYGEYL